MGKKMASWNGYTPEKSSDLYLASGDTTDWAYEELKIFAFTFELTPNSIFAGGFYPGAKAIQPTFNANLEPALYLIEYTDDPYRVLQRRHDPLHLLN
jgi:carboxypeptidase T